MEHLVTLPEPATAPSITEVVFEVPAPSLIHQQRGRRILEIREAIQSGEYRVCARDLADAMLRSVRRAN